MKNEENGGKIFEEMNSKFILDSMVKKMVSNNFMFFRLEFLFLIAFIYFLFLNNL